MRQAIRVYAIVALVAMVALTAGLWANPASPIGGQGWVDETLGLVADLQLWVLLVIPLGVLAAGDAAHAGRRGWLALFIALLMLAPVAAWIGALTNNIEILFSLPCLPDTVCPSGPFGVPQFVEMAGWALALLPVPLAALVYSFTLARSAAGPAAAEASQGARRALIVCAIAGIVLVSALGYLGTSDSLRFLLGPRSIAQWLMISSLQIVLFTIWLTLATLPVAIASMALAHAARTGRSGWLAGWIALIPLALLTADFGSIMGGGLILAATGAWEPSAQDLALRPYHIASIVAPALIMLVALIYARIVMRPEQRAAVPATA